MKGLPLVYKCVFHRPDYNIKVGSHEFNFDGLKIQIWNISMDRTVVAEKNSVTCLVMFTLRAIVI